ncbi:MAG TPA: hypothetical protein VFT95_11435 [Micromonosporaceae bacterium]|nr:hypothetical protein [Micromonosporaceae bacterium]
MGRTSRTQRAQRVAGDAWDQLVSAVESAGDTARYAKRKTTTVADGVGSSVTAATDEARRRAGAALDALAGRRVRTRWEWVIGAVVAGLVVGWFANANAKRAVAEGEARDETPEKAGVYDSAASPEY